MQPVNQLGLLLYFLEENRRNAGRRDATGPAAHPRFRAIAARVMIRIATWLEPDTSRSGHRPAGQPSAQGFNR